MRSGFRSRQVDLLVAGWESVFLEGIQLFVELLTEPDAGEFDLDIDIGTESDI
jgi:hypothetical protein